MAIIAEYVWIDGSVHAKIAIEDEDYSQPRFEKDVELSDFPDGLSMVRRLIKQEGDVRLLTRAGSRCIRPIRGGDSFLVLCEVLNADGTAHETNERAKLRTVLDRGADATELSLV